MKKIALFLCGVVLILAIVLTVFDPFRGNQTDKNKQVDTSESTTYSSQNRSLFSSSEEEKETETSSNLHADLSSLEVIRDFTDRWLTFTSIYERNQSVRDYLTDTCIQENAIDVNPNVEYETKGSVRLLTQDVTNPTKFVVIGTQEAKGLTNEFVLELDLTTENKINTITMYDVRSGY